MSRNNIVEETVLKLLKSQHLLVIKMSNRLHAAFWTKQMFLVAQKILKIIIESKVTIPSSSLAAEENHLRFCLKRNNWKILMALNSILTLEPSYAWLIKYLPILQSIMGENVRDSDWIKLFSWIENNFKTTQDEDLWQF